MLTAEKILIENLGVRDCAREQTSKGSIVAAINHMLTSVNSLDVTTSHETTTYLTKEYKTHNALPSHSPMKVARHDKRAIHKVTMLRRLYRKKER